MCIPVKVERNPRNFEYSDLSQGSEGAASAGYCDEPPDRLKLCRPSFSDDTEKEKR